jgi:hypothetical protein
MVLLTGSLAKFANNRELGEPLLGFQHQIVQAGSTSGYVLVKLCSHAAFPEFLKVIGYPGYGLVARVGGEIQSNLVGHVNHVFGRHW